MKLGEETPSEYFLCLRYRTAFEVLACFRNRLNIVYGPSDLMDFRGSQSSPR